MLFRDHREHVPDAWRRFLEVLPLPQREDTASSPLHGMRPCLAIVPVESAQPAPPSATRVMPLAPHFPLCCAPLLPHLHVLCTMPETCVGFLALRFDTRVQEALLKLRM